MPIATMASSPAPALTTLPAHVLCLIFARLPCEDRRSLALTCKMMAEIARTWRVFSDMEIILTDPSAVEFALRQRCRSVSVDSCEWLEMYAVCCSAFRSQGIIWPLDKLVIDCDTADSRVFPQFRRLGGMVKRLVFQSHLASLGLPSDMGRNLPALAHLKLDSVSADCDLSALADLRGLESLWVECSDDAQSHYGPLPLENFSRLTGLYLCNVASSGTSLWQQIVRLTTLQVRGD